MRVVVAGGSGFLGSRLTVSLLDTGHSVAVLTRDVVRTRGRVDARAELVEWDGRSPGPWEQAIEGAGTVVNLAGEPIAAKRWTDERKRDLIASRVAATRAVVEAIRKAAERPAVLVSASGVGYYGARGDEPLGEDAPAGSDFLSTLCREREAAARAAEPLGVRVTLMRTGVVLAEGAPALERMVRLSRLFLGGPLGSGRQWWPWIHLDDVIGLYRFALENDTVSGPLNVTAPEPVTMADFSRTLARVLGRPSWLPKPAPLLRLLLGEMAGMLLAGQRAEPREALRLGYRFRFPRLEPALRAILRHS